MDKFFITDLKGLDQVKNKDDFIVKIHNNDINKFYKKILQFLKEKIIWIKCFLKNLLKYLKNQTIRFLK